MRGQLQFLVKWEGYGYEENSWVLESDIAAPDKIWEFYNAHPCAPWWIHSVAFHSLISHASRMQHARRGVMSGDDLFSTPKLSQSFANSDLRHLWHSSNSNHHPVPETLWSTSYFEPLPAVPSTATCSFHSDPLPNTLSGDDLFSAPKTSRSFSNSDLGHLWHSSDSDCLPVPETLWSTSYSEPLPAVPNATACYHVLPRAPSIPTPHLTPPPEAAPRAPPPPKVTRRPLWILHPPIQSLVWHSLQKPSEP